MCSHSGMRQLGSILAFHVVVPIKGFWMSTDTFIGVKTPFTTAPIVSVHFSCRTHVSITLSIDHQLFLFDHEIVKNLTKDPFFKLLFFSFRFFHSPQWSSLVLASITEFDMN